jgi:hypothetical protein
MKTEDEGSRVLHVRGLPDDVSEHEIWKLVLPFKLLGLMVNFMHLKVQKKNYQAKQFFSEQKSSVHRS